MKPVFFSVSNKDVAFAERLWSRFTPDLVYLYSKSGLEGADMWQEIEKQELPNARALVIFWSREFALSEGTQREIALARRLFESRLIKGVAILRIDDYPLFPEKGEKDFAVLMVHENMRPFLDVVRASRQKIPEDLAYAQIEALVLKHSMLVPPVFPRPLLEEELLRHSRINHTTCKPLIWVSGLNGNGRKTLVRETYRRIDPNATVVEVDISECVIPKQLVLRLESEGFQADHPKLQALNADPKTDSPEAVAQVIERIRKSGRYVILRQQRLIEDTSALPEWLYEVAERLEAQSKPAVFVISQVPIPPQELQRHSQRIGAIRVPGFSPLDATEFAWSLIRFYDAGSARWTPELVKQIVRQTDGVPELLISAIRLIAISSEDPEMAQEVVSQEVERFSQSLTKLIHWALSFARRNLDDMKLLAILQEVNPASLDVLRSLLVTELDVAPALARLHSYGLIERSDSGLFRVSPLLSKRLDRHLLDPELMRWKGKVFNAFCKRPHEFEGTDHEYLNIEIRLDLGLRFSSSEIPADLRDFICASHWFQAGVRLYSRRHYRDAHSLLKLSFENRSAFNTATQLESIRYFGLASVRNHEDSDVADAIHALTRMPGGGDLLEYLRGFECEMDSRFLDAIPHYERALKPAVAKGSRDREQRVLRALVNCILRTSKPNFASAERYAERALDLGRTQFSLMMLARVCLRRWYLDPYLADGPEKEKVWDRYLGTMESIESLKDGGSIYAELRAEEDELAGDILGAVAWMDDAITADGRFENHLRRWKLMVRSKDAALCRQVLDEIDRVFEDPAFRADLRMFHEPVMSLCAMAEKVAGLGHGQKRFGRYGQGLASSTLAKITRNVDRLEPDDSRFMPGL